MSDSEGESAHSDTGGATAGSTSVCDVTTAVELKDISEVRLDATRVITVDAAARISALQEQRFTEPNKWAYLMPFTPDAEADEWLNENIRNLTALILIDDMSSEVASQLSLLSRYVGKYGLRFHKEQHCKLIKMVYGLIVRPRIRASIAHDAADVFVKLLRGSQFTRDTLLLDWQPLFDQMERIILRKEVYIDVDRLQLAGIKASNLYAKGAEKEIWKRVRPYIAPRSMHIASHLVMSFMPSEGFTREDLEMREGDLIDDHFLPVLFHFYERAEINGDWTLPVVCFFLRLTKDSPHAALPFFLPHIHLIFTRLMRSFGLTARDGKVTIEGVTQACPYYGQWIGYLLGADPCVEAHLLRLLAVVTPQVHPTRGTETATTHVLEFLYDLAVIIMKRCRRTTQIDRKMWCAKQDELPPLSDSAITTVITALLPILVPALHGDTSEAMGGILGALAFLRPGLIIPKILDEFYPSIFSLSSDGRLKTSLAALKRMLILIASDRVERGGYSDARKPTEKDWMASIDNANDRLSITEERKRKRRLRKTQKFPLDKTRSPTEKKVARGSDEDLQTDITQCDSDNGPRSDNTQSDSDAVHSLRPHLVYIAEALLDCLDVNDTDKAVLAYEVYTLLFVVMPIVDCSMDAEQTGDATEEELRLIQLSRRLWYISGQFVEKTFGIIEAFATNAPSTNGLESVEGIKDSDAFAKQGSEESDIQECIERAFESLLEHSDDRIGKILCETVLHFARTSLLDNNTSAGIVSSMIATCVSKHPACVQGFLDFIVTKTERIVDNDTQQAERVDGQGAWLASIAPGFCTLQAADILANFEDLFGMGSRLLACRNKVMYEAGCNCFSALVVGLLGTAPMSSPATRFAQARAPSKLWGQMVNGQRWIQQWSRPGKAESAAAGRLLKASFAAEMRRLAKPDGLSREQLRKSIAIVAELFPDIIEFAPMPTVDLAPTHHMHANGLPPPKLHPTRAYEQLPAADFFTFEGRNLREELMGIVERLIETCHDSQALERLVELIPLLKQDGVVKPMTFSPVLAMLQHALLMDLAMTPELIRHKLLAYYDKEPPSRDFRPSTFECRVMRALFKLSFSLYDTVRRLARDYLELLLGDFSNSTLLDEFIDQITQTLHDERPEITKGALQLLVSLGLPASKRVEVRARIWPLLLKCRRPDDTEQLVLLDACYDQVTGRWNEIQAEAFPLEYLQFVESLLKETPAAGGWTNAADVTSMLEASRAIIKERRDKISEMYADLSAFLHAALRASSALSPLSSETTVDLVADKEIALPPDFDSANTPDCSDTMPAVEATPAAARDHSPDIKSGRSLEGGGVKGHFPLLAPSSSPHHFHLRTRDLCVEMIGLVENSRAAQETMKEIILPRLLDDRIEQRDSALDDLLFWLRKNKPKTAREQWACPPKVQGATGITYGLRPDNVEQVYDSLNLPDTEQKWNAARFFRKRVGHFAWPADGKISLPASGTPIPLGRLMSGVDRAIVDWFANRDNVHQLFEMTLVHLDETGHEFEFDRANMIKYLLRNYPDVASSHLLPPLREALGKLLAGKHVHEGANTKPAINLKLATGRLAAELFLGIAKGTKYLPFNVLDELWKWMAPTVIAEFDRQNFQATHFWSTAFDKLLREDDMRRYWWLVEGLISSFDANKIISPDERWKPANRLSLFALNSWRHSETLNRVLSIAFDQLVPIATNYCLRAAISSLIADSVIICDSRSEFFSGVPERFRVRSLDEYLETLAHKAYKMSRQASPLLLEQFDPSDDKENRRKRKSAAPMKKEKYEGTEQLNVPMSPKRQLPARARNSLSPSRTPTTTVSMAGARTKGMNEDQGQETLKAALLLSPMQPSLPRNSLTSSLSRALSTAGSADGRMRGSAGAAASKGDDVGQEKESLYARILIKSIATFYGVTNVPFTDGIFKVLPLLCELAVEDETDDVDIDSEHDIREDAQTIVHQHAACSPLNEASAVRLVETMEMIVTESTIASQRATALKFLHVMVISNIFLFDRMGIPFRQRIRAIITTAIVDKELNVRREASNCLCAFLHIGYLELNDGLEAHFRSLLSSSSLHDKQAGCLGFAAIVGAFPDAFTVKVVPALRELCRLSSGAANAVIVQQWATNALRDFRASHSFDWRADAAAVLGAELMDRIDNLLSPSYYV